MSANRSVFCSNSEAYTMRMLAFCRAEHRMADDVFDPTSSVSNPIPIMSKLKTRGGKLCVN